MDTNYKKCIRFLGNINEIGFVDITLVKYDPVSV
jgi:hypothetical protein